MNLHEYVEKKLVFSPLCEGRNKGDMNEVLGCVLTLVDFDIVSDNQGKPYSVCLFKEIEDKFFFGGMVLTDILTDIYADYCGEDKTPKMVLAENDPLVFKLTKERSKTGREYVKVNMA